MNAEIDTAFRKIKILISLTNIKELALTVSRILTLWGPFAGEPIGIRATNREGITRCVYY